MQRSGQTAKTQSSAEAPGRRALSPAPSWEAKERAPTRAASRREGRLGQPGALGRRGSPSVPGLGPLAAPQRPALRNAPPRPCGELRSLSRGGTCEQHHPHGTGFGSRPRSAGPRDGREGARLREATPAGAAGERGLRSAATTARKLRRRPSSVPGGQSLPEAAGGGKSFSRGAFPTCDTSGTSVCSTERVRISSPASAPSPDEDDEEMPLLLHGDVAIAGEPGRDSLQPRRRRAPARAARAPPLPSRRPAPGPPPPPGLRCRAGRCRARALSPPSAAPSPPLGTGWI